MSTEIKGSDLPLEAKIMITLICKMDKNNGKAVNTVYADGEKWFTMDDDSAYDMVQKNTVKKFNVVETKFVYIETYEF